MGEVHGVFVAIDLHRLLIAVILIGVVRVAPRIDRPHVPLGLTLGDPFGQNLTGAATLRDAKGKHAGLKGIRHARHRPDQWQTVGRVGDRAIDDAAHTL